MTDSLDQLIQDMASNLTISPIPTKIFPSLFNTSNPEDWQFTLVGKTLKPTNRNIEHVISIRDKFQMVKRSFFFSLEEIAMLKKHMPTHLQMCSKVEVLVACLWQCRTTALGLDFENETRLALSTNVRAKFNPPLPVEYYGVAFGKPVAITTAGELCRKPLAYAVGLIQRAKAEVTEEFMRSTLDLLAGTKPPSFETELTFHVSDLTKMRFVDVDFGWGKAAYGGPIWGGHPASFLISSKYKGEDGIVVTINLPKASTGNFAAVVEGVIRSNTRSRSAFLTSHIRSLASVTHHLLLCSRLCSM